MTYLSFSLSKNYAFELSAFHRIRDKKDGSTFLDIEINFDRYKGDHSPKFLVMLTILNFKIFEINIYNKNHESRI